MASEKVNLAADAFGDTESMTGPNAMKAANLDVNTGATHVNMTTKPVPINQGTRVPFVNLFKNNRMPKDNHKLEFRDAGTGKLKFGEEMMYSVEKTYGICLLGYVISGKPPNAALLELVRRWGSNIKFQTHANGWIIFTFPNEEVKERVLSGGTYMVFGYHLFLKEMPRCFRFREEDMNYLPSWVQIHGLPPDCWTFDILSILASRVGKPIQMDMLTHDRKRVNYARCLIEIDATKPKLEELEIKLLIGDVKIRFEYEQDIKFCELCHRAGHEEGTCYILKRGNDRERGCSRSTLNRDNNCKDVAATVKSTRATTSRSVSRGSRFNVLDDPGTSNMDVGHDLCDENEEIQPQPVDQLLCELESEDFEMQPVVTLAAEQEVLLAKGKNVLLSELPVMGKPPNEGKMTTDVGLLSKTSGSNATEADGCVNKKNNKKKEKKKKNKKGAEGVAGNDGKMAAFFEDLDDSDSCNTEFVAIEGGHKDARFFGKETMGRQPKIASGPL